MDNANFHKSAKTKELIESVGCKIVFLPPYSPDFNPIEKFWANMKRWIKQQIEEHLSLYDVISAFFMRPQLKLLLLYVLAYKIILPGFKCHNCCFY